MQSLFGGWDKVVLFFGFMDDFKNCEELKEYNQGKYPEKKISLRISKLKK